MHSGIYSLCLVNDLAFTPLPKYDEIENTILGWQIQEETIH